ncbi:MAG: energy-coupling factor transporter transmembrane protein EcfT [Pirellulaceae bacterium]|jgi:cobalt/nickel transport system permease protein|nr:energy-coupling factor transporter transmembrane protein EcfT [Pirellulaceae bacterium]
MLMERVDPRTRIAAAVVFSGVIAAAQQPATAGIALLAAAAATPCTRLTSRQVLKRLLPVNVFALLLIVALSWADHVSPIAARHPEASDHTGLGLALMITAKANAIVLWVVVFLGTMDLITLGHALRHLHVPDKLTHLLLFTVRYLDVLHGEYLRLRTSMKLRGFQPRLSTHTYRTLGYLVGMLLVRSLDRSERILAAMKCRGFRGRFYLLDHFTFSRRDLGFLLVACAVLCLLAIGEAS